MSLKTQPGKDKKIASALLLSYPQMFVWALIFAAIGGVTVWSSQALNNNDSSGTLQLRMVSDYNGNGQPNWNDMVVFDTANTGNADTHINVVCYKNGHNMLSVTKNYGSGTTTSDHAIQLSSATWQSGAADCQAALVDSTKAKTLNSYYFHVNP